jgi:uncharacterized protein (TIGR02266 family)
VKDKSTALASLDLNLTPSIHTNTRQSLRVRVFVTVDIESEHNFWTGLTLDLSEGGVFVATHHQVPRGSVVLLNLTLPECDEPIITAAWVRWTRDYCPIDEIPPGLGLQFMDLDLTAKARIRRFVFNTRVPLLFEDRD